MVRFLIGVLFVVVALFEVGSHSYFDAQHHDEEVSTTSVDQHQSESDDNCKPYFGCVDERDDQEPQQPNAQDQNTHHDVLAASNVVKFVRYSDSIERSLTFGSVAKSRPPSLLFHPPKTI